MGVGMALLIILIIAVTAFAMYKTKANTSASDSQNSQPVKSDFLEDWVPGDTTELIKAAPAPDPMLGYSNLPTWDVKGKRATTGRTNKRQYAVSTAEKAKALAIEEGLIEPLDVKISDFEPKLPESSAPDGSSRYDAYELFDSADAHDVVPITKGFWDYATRKEVHLSWFTGRNKAANRVYAALTPHEKAVLFGYAVYCSLHSEELRNVLEDQNYSLFEGFADAADQRPDVITSIMKREGSDIWQPSTRSNAYKFAAEYFERYC